MSNKPEFKKFNSLENSYRDNFISKIREQGFESEEYIVTEKLHGANYSFTVVIENELPASVVPNDYKRIDLNFIKEIRQKSGDNVKYALQPTLDIYVSTDDYDKYEFALKVLSNNYLNTDWELVNGWD